MTCWRSGATIKFVCLDCFASIKAKNAQQHNSHPLFFSPLFFSHGTNSNGFFPTSSRTCNKIQLDSNYLFKHTSTQSLQLFSSDSTKAMASITSAALTNLHNFLNETRCHFSFRRFVECPRSSNSLIVCFSLPAIRLTHPRCDRTRRINRNPIRGREPRRWCQKSEKFPSPKNYNNK